MAIVNKVTTFRTSNIMTNEEIQSHINEQNLDGWYLITLDNLVGWYRFFWGKNVE